MKRLVALFGCLMFFASPALATSTFSKVWKDKYIDKEEMSEETYREFRKAGCYICHVRKHPDKKEARNEYGRAVHKFLQEEDFPKDWVKENEEEATKMILAGFKKANELKSEDGKKFGEKIEAGKLPAVDMEYEGEE